MNEGSVLNYFSSTTWWVLIVQGVILMIGLSLGFYVLYHNFFNLAKKKNRLTEKWLETLGDHLPFLLKTLLLVKEKKNAGDATENNEGDAAGKNENASTEKYLALLRYMSSFVCFTLFLVIFILCCGLTSNRIADKWIDQKTLTHFGLKNLWTDNDGVHQYYDSIGNFLGSDEKSWEHLSEKEKGKIQKKDVFYVAYCGETDAYLKLKMFDQVFFDNPTLKKLPNPEKKEIYFTIKNRMIASNERDFLEITQTVTNLIQVLCLSFFCMFILLFISFIPLIRGVPEKSKNWVNGLFWGLIFIYLLALTCFHLGYPVALVEDCHRALPLFLLSIPILFYIIIYWILEQRSLRIIITTGLIYLSATAYYFSCIAWEESEMEFDIKVLTHYKYNTKNFNIPAMQKFLDAGVLKETENAIEEKKQSGDNAGKPSGIITFSVDLTKK